MDFPLSDSHWRGAARALHGFLYQVAPLDPSTLAAVPLLLASSAALATVLASLRIARVDPAQALRN